MNRRNKNVEEIEVFQDDISKNDESIESQERNKKIVSNREKQEKRIRPRRKKINEITVLNYPARKGYIRRVFNDKEGRIKRFEERGWSVVMKADMEGGDDRAGKDSQMGTPVMHSVGGGMKGVLMEIPEEWHKEDQEDKQREVDRTEEGLRQQNQEPGRYGNIEITK